MNRKLIEDFPNGLQDSSQDLSMNFLKNIGASTVHGRLQILFSGLVMDMLSFEQMSVGLDSHLEF